MIDNKCPHCKRHDCVPVVVFRNVDNYGDKTYHVACENCGKMIAVRMSRKVHVEDISKSSRPANQADF